MFMDQAPAPALAAPPVRAVAHHPEARLGLAYALLAYGAWGLFPLYFRQVAHIEPLQVLAHRVFWSVPFLALLILLTRRAAELRAVVASGRTMLTLVASTATIAVNWYVFIYAIATRQVLQCSLGYFINPLVSVMLGMLFLKERLRPLQVAGVVLAAAGVANLAISAGQLPWVALTLALTFGLYGLIRKTTAAGPMVGLMVETSLLFPFSVWLIGRDLWPAGGSYGLTSYLWLSCAGVITAVPLLWFAGAARRLRLSTIGFLQYIAPSVHFLLAVAVFGEKFTGTHLVTFCFIWSALAMYSVDSWRALRQPPAAAPAA
jgi:chloramphenicol-sensitive protein RarD